MFKVIEKEIKQTTLAKPISIKGFSAYDRKICEVTIEPAEPNTGIIFSIDGKKVAAMAHNLNHDTYEHTTVLASKEAEIRTVEHILSALWGMNVDNAIINLHGGDIPFISSSAVEYAKAISEAGVLELSENRKYIVPLEEYKLIEPDSDGYIIIKPSDNDNITAVLDFDNILGKQIYSGDVDSKEYLDNISFARSFMRSALDDAGQKWAYLRKLFPAIPEEQKDSPIIIFNEQGYVTPLTSSDEPIKHKVLDFIGDIALLGNRLSADVYIYKPGHRFTHYLAKEILKILNENQ